MNLKDILHELAGRVNAAHLHEEIDALPDGDAPAEPEAEADAPKGGKK
jgi:hypothetical protein